MARRKLFGGQNTPPQPESYRMPLAFIDGPRHPAPVRRVISASAGLAMDAAFGDQVTAVELMAQGRVAVDAVAERPLDVQGIVSGRATPSTRTAIHGLSSRLGSVT